MIRYLIAFFLLSLACSAQVKLHPSDNVPKIVNSKPGGTTFVFTPGTYRLSEPIIPKDNDKFIGESSCAPPASSCPAIISGGVVIGSLATEEGGNYAAAKQKQQGARGNPKVCDRGWEGCYYPEDLFFDDQPQKHVDSPTLPALGPGEWWFDYTNHVIYFHDDPSGHTVETSVLNTAFAGSANNVTIQYLTVKEIANMYPTGAIGAAQGKDTVNQGANWRVENNEITLIHGFGVRTNYGIQILNNYIHDNGQMGIGGGLGNPTVPSRVLIQGNTINHNNYAHFNPGFGAGGFKVGATAGVVLRGNTIQNNEGSGIHFDIDGQNELVDGNTITDNIDADGIVQEIGFGTSIFRNNIVLRNGAHPAGSGPAYQIAVHASSGVEIYCNVIEIPPGSGIGGWSIGSSNRGNSTFPPYQYRATVGNSVHHNTVIWDPGADGEVGFRHNDPANQPDFFAKNAPPDDNSYHLPNKSAPVFVYDNDNSRSNRRKPFSNHQSARADVHSTVDTNNTSGFPNVSITSPPNQSSVTNPVTVSAAASDKSGIRKVEFYVDWKLQTTLTNPPYDFNWTNGTTGSHIVAAMAYSNAGINDCYAVTLNEQ
jgi:parallel beta-helix repeat protein